MRPRCRDLPAVGALAVLGGLLGAAGLRGCGGEPSFFAWEREEVSVGGVFRHAEWTGRLGWEITGRRAIEILGLQVDCGCLSAELLLEDGVPLAPGIYPPGTRGEVVLRVRPDRQPRELHERARMVWRLPGEETPTVTDLHVLGEVLDAWEVGPPQVRMENVPPGQTPEVVLRWRALVDVAGSPEAAFEGGGWVLDDLVETAAPGGRREITLRGRIVRPCEGHEAAGRIRLLGLDPPAPPVPLHVAFARRVTASPQRILTLLPREEGGFGAEVILRAGAVASPAALAPRLEIEPAELEGWLAVEREDLSPGGVRLLLTLPVEAAAVRRFGSLLIHHGIETDPPVRLFWYLRS